MSYQTNELSQRKIAIVTGILFLLGLAFYILNLIYSESIINSQDYLLLVSANDNNLILGGVFILFSALSIAAIPIILFPILSKHNETIAIGYIVARIIEAVVLIIIALSSLLILSLGREYVKVKSPMANNFETLGLLLHSLGTWSQLFSIIIFGFGAMLFYFILYQSKLIPRFLSIWGLIGAPLHLIGGLVCIFGMSLTSIVSTILLTPITLNEIVLAIWLIIRGFNQNSNK